MQQHIPTLPNPNKKDGVRRSCREVTPRGVPQKQCTENPHWGVWGPFSGHHWPAKEVVNLENSIGHSQPPHRAQKTWLLSTRLWKQTSQLEQDLYITVTPTRSPPTPAACAHHHITPGGGITPCKYNCGKFFPGWFRYLIKSCTHLLQASSLPGFSRGLPCNLLASCHSQHLNYCSCFCWNHMSSTWTVSGEICPAN